MFQELKYHFLHLILQNPTNKHTFPLVSKVLLLLGKIYYFSHLFPLLLQIRYGTLATV